MVPHGEPSFVLKVKGDSMINERIGQGDIVYVRKQDYLDDKDNPADFAIKKLNFAQKLNSRE